MQLYIKHRKIFIRYLIKKILKNKFIIRLFFCKFSNKKKLSIREIENFSYIITEKGFLLLSIS